MSAPVAVVTGAAQGIGRETALAFAAAGYRVVANDLEPAPAGAAGSELATLVGQIEAAGGVAAAAPGSVSDEAAVVAMFALAYERYGRVDVLVNNAGVARDRMIFNLPLDDWDTVIATSLRGTFLCSREFMRQLRARERFGGSIITMTSAAGMYGNIGQTNYSAAKAGILGLTMTLAHEGRRSGVLAVAIAPWARTGLSASIAGTTPDAIRRREFLSRMDPKLVANGIVAVAAAGDANLSGKVIGLRGREVMVFGQPRRLGSAVAGSGGEPDDYAAALAELRRGLAPTPAAGDVFNYEPPL